MTPTAHNLNYLLGGPHFDYRPDVPFSSIVLDFLHAVSNELRTSPDTKNYPDVMAFAFWCRRSHLLTMKKEFDDGLPRLGRGLVFHIAPSNVPVNFAYSLAFGLLSGNANLVRVSSKPFAQVDIICKALAKVLRQSEFSPLTSSIHLVRYDHNDEITSDISANSHCRIIWGGDSTIRSIRRHQITERGVDLAFADRYSMAVIDPQSIMDLNANELATVASSFYNDSFLMDQNACSSPHLVVWLGPQERINQAKSKFWEALYTLVQSKYPISEKTAVDKYTLECQNAIDVPEIRSIKKYQNAIYTIDLKSLPEGLEKLRGNSGFFYEYSTADLNVIAPIINQKYQTMSYFGVAKQRLLDFVKVHRLTGIDRIVPIGTALSMEPIWDGYHVLQSLSRIIDVR